MCATPPRVTAAATFYCYSTHTLKAFIASCHNKPSSVMTNWEIKCVFPCWPASFAGFHNVTLKAPWCITVYPGALCMHYFSVTTRGQTVSALWWIYFYSACKIWDYKVLLQQSRNRKRGQTKHSKEEKTRHENIFLRKKGDKKTGGIT